MKKGVKIQQPSWIFPTTFLLPFKHAWPAVGCNIHSDTRALTINSESCWTNRKPWGPKQRSATSNNKYFPCGYRKKSKTTYPTFIQSLSWSMTHSSVHGIPSTAFGVFLHAFGPKKFLKFLISSAPPRCIPIEVI